MNENKDPRDPKQQPAARGVLHLLDDPRIRAVVAFLLAVVGWVVVTVGIQPGTDRTITHVPVDFSYESARYTAMGLSIVNDPVKNVSLKVYGNGSDIGSLKKEDFIVYPKYASVKGPGEATLSLEVKCIAENVETGNIKVNVMPSDAEVDLVFDKVEKKTIPVHVSAGAEQVRVAEGFTLYNSQTVPAEVGLQGPVSELKRVVSAVAAVSVEGELDRTTTLTVPLVFLDAEGEPVELNYVKPETETVDVTLTVYQEAELPLVVTLINTPPGFDESSMKYTLSQSTLQVAGPASVIKNMTELSVGSIDLSTFALDKVYELPIELPEGLVSQENVTEVTVNFEVNGLATKTLNLDQDAVQIVNLPSSYHMEVLSSRIRNVVLCGPKEALEGLTAESVVARIDMDALNVVTGQQTIAVNIYVPADNRVFALGTYSVSCQIESQ